MSPENSTKSLIRNNYDDNVSHMMATQKHKTDYVVEMKIPKANLEDCTGNRDVKKYTGDVNLNNYEHKIYKRETTE